MTQVETYDLRFFNLGGKRYACPLGIGTTIEHIAAIHDNLLVMLVPSIEIPVRKHWSEGQLAAWKAADVWDALLVTYTDAGEIDNICSEGPLFSEENAVAFMESNYGL